MLKTLLSISIAGAMMSAPSFASNLLSTLSNPHKIQHTSPVKKNAPVNETYTNFSGQWKGRCVIGDQESSDKIKIENDQHHLIINGQVHFIDSMSSEALSNEYVYNNEHRKFLWNQDGTLGLHATTAYAEHYANAPMIAVISDFTFELNVNDEFIINGESHAFLNGEKAQTVKIDCVYTRMK